MSSYIMFFATKNDLIPILDSLEAKRSIKYVKYGSSNTPAPEWYPTVRVLPDLGIASQESAINCSTYLICQRSEVIHARQVAGPRYLFDQLVNPETITFTAGGIWGEDVLLHGRFGTASTGLISLDLMKILRAAVRKRFDRIKAFYVGEEAAQMLDSGMRLTIAAQSPRSFDLAR